MRHTRANGKGGVIVTDKAKELIEGLNVIHKSVKEHNSYLGYVSAYSVLKLTSEKIITGLCAEIEALKKANEWISVEDGLPKMNQVVIVKRDSGKIGICDYKSKIFIDSLIGLSVKVTHWKPFAI